MTDIIRTQEDLDNYEKRVNPVGKFSVQPKRNIPTQGNTEYSSEKITTINNNPIIKDKEFGFGGDNLYDVTPLGKPVFVPKPQGIAGQQPLGIEENITEEGGYPNKEVISKNIDNIIRKTRLGWEVPKSIDYALKGFIGLPGDDNRYLIEKFRKNIAPLSKDQRQNIYQQISDSGIPDDAKTQYLRILDNTPVVSVENIRELYDKTKPNLKSNTNFGEDLLDGLSMFALKENPVGAVAEDISNWYNKDFGKSIKDYWENVFTGYGIKDKTKQELIADITNKNIDESTRTFNNLGYNVGYGAEMMLMAMATGGANLFTGGTVTGTEELLGGAKILSKTTQQANALRRGLREISNANKMGLVFEASNQLKGGYGEGYMTGVGEYIGGRVFDKAITNGILKNFSDKMSKNVPASAALDFTRYMSQTVGGMVEESLGDMFSGSSLSDLMSDPYYFKDLFMQSFFLGFGGDVASSLNNRVANGKRQVFVKAVNDAADQMIANGEWIAADRNLLTDSAIEIYDNRDKIIKDLINEAKQTRPLIDEVIKNGLQKKGQEEITSIATTPKGEEKVTPTETPVGVEPKNVLDISQEESYLTEEEKANQWENESREYVRNIQDNAYKKYAIDYSTYLAYPGMSAPKGLNLDENIKSNIRLDLQDIRVKHYGEQELEKTRPSHQYDLRGWRERNQEFYSRIERPLRRAIDTWATNPSEETENAILDQLDWVLNEAEKEKQTLTDIADEFGKSLDSKGALLIGALADRIKTQKRGSSLLPQTLHETLYRTLNWIGERAQTKNFDENRSIYEQVKEELIAQGRITQDQINEFERNYNAESVGTQTATRGTQEGLIQETNRGLRLGGNEEIGLEAEKEKEIKALSEERNQLLSQLSRQQKTSAGLDPEQLRTVVQLTVNQIKTAMVHGKYAYKHIRQSIEDTLKSLGINYSPDDIRNIYNQAFEEANANKRMSKTYAKIMGRDTSIRDDVVQVLSEQYHDVMDIKNVADEALKAIKKDVSAAENEFMNDSTPDSPYKHALGVALTRYYQGIGNVDKEIDILDKTFERRTKAGQLLYSNRLLFTRDWNHADEYAHAVRQKAVIKKVTDNQVQFDLVDKAVKNAESEIENVILETEQKKQKKQRLTYKPQNVNTKETVKGLTENRGSLWERYKAGATKNVVSRLDAILKQDNPPPPIKEFVRLLTSEINQRIPKKEGVEQRKLTAIEAIKEISQNREKYVEVIESAKIQIESKYSGKDLEILNEIFSNWINKPFSNTLISKLSKEGLNNQTINRIVKLGIENNIPIKDIQNDVINEVLTKTEMENAEYDYIKNILQKDVEDRINKYTESAKERKAELDRIRKERKQKVEEAKTDQQKAKKLLREIDKKEVKSIADIIKKRYGMIPTNKYNKLFNRIAETISQQGSIDDKVLKEMYAQMLGMPEMTNDQYLSIKKMGEQIEKKPEGIAKQQAIYELLNKIGKMNGITNRDLFWTIFAGNIFSAPGTHTTNLMANNALLAMETAILGTRLSWQLKSLTGYKIITQDVIRGMFDRGTLEAANIMKTGYVPHREKFATDRRITEMIEKGDYNAITNLYAQQAKYIFRALSAEDALAYFGAERGYARLLLVQQQMARGKSAKEAMKYADQQLGSDKEVWDNAVEQAKMEGYKSKSEINRRAYQIIDDNMDREIQRESKEYADMVTYNNEPYGQVGALANIAINIGKEIPELRFLSMAARTMSNVTNMSLQYSPYGFYRAIKGYKNLPVTPELQSQVIARAVAGTAMMLTLSGLIAKSDDDDDPMFDITGANPFTPSKKHQIQVDRPPFSIKLFGEWFTYKYTPLFLPFSALGTVHDSYKYNKGSSWWGNTGYGVIRGFTGILDQTAFSTLNDFFDIISMRNIKEGTTIDEVVKSIGRFFIKIAKSATVPNWVSEIDKLAYPKITDKQTVTDILVRDFPVARAYLGKPMLGSMGEELEYDVMGKYLERMPMLGLKDKTKYADVYSFMTSQELFPNPPSRNTTVDGERISEEEYRVFLKAYGKEVARIFRTEIMPDFEKFKDENDIIYKKEFKEYFKKNIKKRAKEKGLRAIGVAI